MAAPATQFNENASPIHFSEKYKSFLENLSAADIPPLPAIPEDLKKTASTHLSAHGRKTQDFDDKDPEAFNADYEHMEFIGDSLVSMAATSLIQQRYPRLTVSRMTVLKTALVSNQVLGQIGRVYNLHTHLICGGAQLWSLQNSVLIRAQMFEAYVAGIYKTIGLLPTLEYITSLMACFIDLACSELRSHSERWRAEKAASSKKALPGQKPEVQYVSILEEWRVKRGAGKAIEYRKLGSEGPTHDCIWFGELAFDGKVVAQGEGKQWKEIKNALAKDFLTQLKVPLPE